MGNVTQTTGGPFLGLYIPPGMTYNATTNAWTFTGAVSMGTPLVVGTDPGGSETLRVGGTMRVSGATAVGSVSASDATNSFGSTALASNLTVSLRAAAGQNRDLIWKTADVARWMMRVTNTAEAGANAGSNFSFLAFTDAGGLVDTPIEIVRAGLGLMTFGGSTRRTLATTGGRVKYTMVVTDTTTLDTTHNVVVCNKGTAMTINLPAVSGNNGRTYIIKNKGAGVVTIDGNASEQIDNAATLALNQWQTATIVCDGAIWCVI